MLDFILLRYRDITPSINTIDEHNKMVKEKGRVLWGWWKKGSEPARGRIRRDGDGRGREGDREGGG